MKKEYIELSLILSTIVYNDFEYLKNPQEVTNLRFIKKCLEWEYNKNTNSHLVPIDSTYITYSIVDDILFISIAGTITNKQLFEHIYVFLSKIDELNKYCTYDYYYHSEFLEKYRLVKNQLNRIISNNNNKRIIISGHSVGGSIGLLCALLTKLEYPTRIVEFISFGCPNGCGKKTTELINNTLDRCIQFKHIYDFIPKLAFKLLFGSPGEIILLKNKVDESSWYIYHKLETYYECITFDNSDTNELF
jgi:hypothetical protein